MSIHVVGLFDPPSAKSMGMVPVLERLPDGSGIVHGFSAAPGPAMTTERIDAAIAEGAIRAVDVVAERPEGSPMAGWMGLEFLRNAALLGAAVPEASPDAQLVDKLGYVWIDDGSALVSMLERWTLETTRVAIQTRSLPLARLMVWVLPQHIESSSALWYTMPTLSMQAAELVFQTKLRRDAGETITQTELESRFIAIRDKYLQP
jgi:hypothetical protein